MSYTVDTSNIFAVLSGGSNEVQAAAKPVSKEAATTVPTRQGGARKNGTRGRGNGRGRGRGGRVGAPTGATNHASGEVPEKVEGARDVKRGAGRARRERGERGGGDTGERRGSGGGRPKRQYDRQSGTKQGSITEKRAGGGAGNWGRLGDEVEPVPEENNHKDDAEVPEQPVAKSDETVPETDGMMSLEEFERKKVAKSAKIGLPEPRKAGEGEDSSRWTNLEKLNKDEAPEANGANAAAGKKDQQKKKNIVPIQKVFKVQEPKNNDKKFKNEKGGRGKGSAKPGVQFSLSDDASFPTLGGK